MINYKAHNIRRDRANPQDRVDILQFLNHLSHTYDKHAYRNSYV